MNPKDAEPCFVISVAAKMVGVHAQTLRYYEREGIIAPSRSPRDISSLRLLVWRLWTWAALTRCCRAGSSRPAVIG